MISWRQLKDRKLVQWAAAYLAGAWVVLQVLDLVGSAFHWPDAVQQGATVLLGMGFFAALVVAWYHGEKGAQKVGGVELVMLVGILVIAGAAIAFVLRPTRPAATHAAAAGAPGDSASSVATGTASPGAAPDARSLAVLPLTSLGADSAPAYLGEGVSQEILDGLTRLPGLKVIGRASSFRFRGPDVDPRQVGRELGVGALLSGTIQRAGNVLRIDVELMDTRSGVQLWSQTYDRRMGDLFALEDDISRAVLSALSVTLVSGGGRPVVARATGNVEAHDAFLRASALAHGSDEASLEEAIRLFRAATTRDPGYAEAWAGMAGAYYWLGDAYRAPRDVEPLARAAAERAISLDSSLAAGYVVLGVMDATWDRKFAAARAALDRALALDPGVADVHAYLGVLLVVADGNVDAARAEFRKAVSLDPLDPFLPWLEIQAALAQKRYGDALRLADWIRSIDPDFFYFMDSRAAVYMAAGRWADCVSAYDSLPPAVRAQPQYGLAICEARLGQTARARSILARLEAEARLQYVDASTIGTVFAALGEPDSAFTWLGRAAEDHSARLAFSQVLPEFAPLRADPRYAALIRRLGVR